MPADKGDVAYLIGVPVAAAKRPSLPIAPTVPAPVIIPVVQPKPVTDAPAQAAAVAKPPRLPLAIRLDNAMRPAWRLGVGIFFVATAVPIAVCLTGAAIALTTGGNARPWFDAIQFASPLGTVGVPALMIAIKVCADVQRLRLRRLGLPLG